MTKGTGPVIDPATGLPELPGGQFWRITRWLHPEGHYGRWDLELHRRTPTRRRPERSETLATEEIVYELADSEPEAVRYAAEALLERRNRWLSQRDRAGDYPPNRLEA